MTAIKRAKGFALVIAGTTGNLNAVGKTKFATWCQWVNP